MTTSLKEIAKYTENKLPESKAEYVVGIIGENPSTTARSPYVWNAVLEDQNIDAFFYSFDVGAKNLKNLVDALRDRDEVLGFSVTKPYKNKIIPYLHKLDDMAKQIGAVNTVVRIGEGYLHGYNTDGIGAIMALSSPDTSNKVFMPSLSDKKILLMGSGGAARAVAFYLAKEINSAAADGNLLIVGRNGDNAKALSFSINNFFKKGISYSQPEYSVLSNFRNEDGLDVILKEEEFDLIVNATTKGQSGVVFSKDGERVTLLEHYSSLALAFPAYFYYPKDSLYDMLSLYCNFVSVSGEDIERNNATSRYVVGRDNLKNTKFFDIILSPAETIMLRDARLSGHETLNGISMNKYQALEAMRLILNGYTDSHGLDKSKFFDKAEKKIFKI